VRDLGKKSDGVKPIDYKRFTNNALKMFGHLKDVKNNT
jgi:hypothetical protein